MQRVFKKVYFMEPFFERQKRQSTVEIVIDRIKQLIIQKKLLPGQKLPSETEISAGLAVSRGSVREAMKILSAFGIVEIKPGDGTYIPKESNSAIIDPLLFSFLLYNPDMKELSDFRKMIEVDVIELIIRNKDSNADERKALHDNVAQLALLQKEHASSTEFIENDIMFHRILGKACKNRLTQKVYDFAIDYFESTIIETHKKQVEGFVSYATHDEILKAIDLNDLELAQKAIYNSVDVWENLQNP